MITIAQPAFGLNDEYTGSQVQMWEYRTVRRAHDCDYIIDEVSRAARRAPGGKLKNVVFMCHGGAAFLDIGRGIDRRHTAFFKDWRGKVEKIWFAGCQVAQVQRAGAPTRGDGNLFCSEIAEAIQGYVVAATEPQGDDPLRALPFGKLDSYEGLVLSYGPPEWKITWRHRYPSISATRLWNPD